MLAAVAFSLLFGWLYAAPIVHNGYLAESDLYEYFLPVFLSPLTIWSSFEFGGMPAFADPGEASLSPLHFLFARVIGSWTGFVIAAYVLGACGAYAYVFSLTRSRVAAAFSGVAYALSEAMMERLAHLGVVHMMAWLPLVFLTVDRLRGEHQRRWIALGALILANCFLAGNPQTFLYVCYAAAVYGLVGGLVERAGWRYYAAALGTATLGAMLTAVKVLPMLEASRYTARQVMRIENFYGFANTPAQMLSALFPAIAHSGREAPTYVGLATLLCAFVAERRLFADWRVAFWTVLGILTLMIGVGGATPIAELAFHLPFYDRFRVGARHLIVAAFALSVLGGIGLSLVIGRVAGRKVVAGASIGLLLALAAGAATLAAWPGGFEFDDRFGHASGLPIWNDGVWLSLAFGVLTIGVVNAVAANPRAALLKLALVCLLAADLIFALPYGIGAAGLESVVLPEASAQPSRHAVQLGRELAPEHQRLLAVEGTHVDAVVPAAFARAWQIPIAGGYGPMLLAQHGSFASMGTNGSVEPRTLGASHTAFDLLAVKYVTVHEESFTTADTVSRHGLTWTSDALDLPVGPEECGRRPSRRASYGIPTEFNTAAIALAMHLRCSEDVRQGASVGAVRVFDAQGTEVVSQPLRAGIEIAEAHLNDPNLLRRARHTPAVVFDPDASPFSYYLRVPLPASIAGGRIEFDLTDTTGWIHIDRMTALDAAGRSAPLTAASVLMADTSRWRLHTHFATSRETDRGQDDDTRSETRVRVYENLRARPRAWLARHVIPLSDTDLRVAVASSQLPDGRRFDPALDALVSEGTAPGATFDEVGATAHIEEMRDGIVRVAVSAPGGGFLVLSETFYPGWRAEVDNVRVPLYRTYGTLQGVLVPPGRHAVTFTFVSASLRQGSALSALALAVVAAILWRARRATSIAAEVR
jgi:hypothetical protein